MSAKRAPRRTAEAVLVVGLGRFGTACATTLLSMGVEVMALDRDGDLVQRWAPALPHVVQVDTTDEDALRQLDVASFDRAVVAIGTDVEASVLTVLALADAGVEEIWAKAITAKHGEILRRIGAQHVVFPEQSVGERVAHQLVGAMEDYVEFDGFALARMTAPAITWGVPLGRTQLRTTHHVTIIGVRGADGAFVNADAATIVHRGDDILVTGSSKAVETFSVLPVDGPFRDAPTG